MFRTFAVHLSNKEMILRYIKKYPFSLIVVALVTYLSFFKPPSAPKLDTIPHIDKVVHLGMYFVMSAGLWWEFLCSHTKGTSMQRAWIGAFICPVLFSGCVEILQEHCTTYRGGDWFDFLANATGALLASLLFYYILRPRIQQRKQSTDNL